VRMNSAAALLLALAFDAAVAQPAVTPGPSQPVKVTNDASSPVPVTVQGAPLPVSIQGTATISGSVNLANALVPVTVVDDLLNAPLNLHRFDGIFLVPDELHPSGVLSLNVPIDVPNGKRFIVETVAIQGSIPLETPPLPVRVLIGCRETQLSIPFQRAPDPVDSGRGAEEILHAVLPIKMRVDAYAGSSPECQLRLFMRFPPGQRPTATRLIRIDAHMLGYQVDLP